MSSRVTAIRSSQPRIGVGTSDNMVDVLLRRGFERRGRKRRYPYQIGSGMRRKYKSRRSSKRSHRSCCS